MSTTRFRRVLLGTLAPVAIVVVWWLLSASSTSLYFPPLSEIVKSFVGFWLAPAGLEQLGTSMLNFVIGLALGTAAGCALGVGLGLWRWAMEVAAPILEFVRATPAVALIPIVLLVLGLGPFSQISMIAAATVWPILLNTIDGVRSIDPTMRDAMKTFRLSLRDRLFRVILPAASPQIMAGVNIGVTVGLVMIIASELQGATAGVGYTLMAQQRAYDMPGMWSTIILLGTLGFLLNLAFTVGERVLLSWHRQMRSTTKG